VNPERDPELGRLLEHALGSPEPRPGARVRVEQKLGPRLRPARGGIRRWALVTASLLACVLAVKWAERARGGSPRDAPAAAPAISWLALEDARVALLGASRLRVEREDAGETVVRLDAGTALFHVQKGRGRHFVVEAGRRHVEVVGTVFGVALAGDGARVEVMEGVVRTSENGASELLTAGQSSPPGTDVFALAPRDLATLRAPLPPASPRAAPMLVPTAPPSASATALPRHQASSLAPQATAPASPAPSSSVPAIDDGYRAARTLERSGEIAAATEGYRTVALGNGAHADDAAFAVARLAAEHGSPSAVQSAVADYRRTFPSGRYARDIDVLELNAHLARRDRPAALRDADAFLVRFPSDARAWRFRLVRAEEQARAGDCAGAMRELSSVPDGAEKAVILAACTPP